MYFGYNTNGFAHHRLEDAIVILAEMGYEGVGITLDHHALNPFDPDFGQQLGRVRTLLRQYQLRCVIETGARFLLDSRRKHQPTLISEDLRLRQYRLEFLERAVYLAATLEADAVSFWSGAADYDAEPETHLANLVSGCQALCATAERYGVRLALEPEPGMFIDTVAAFADLTPRVNHRLFGLTLDIGHLHCQGEPIAGAIERHRDVLWNVHIEDMRRGVHEHLMFGEGEIDFSEVMRALASADYRGGVFVELSRHSHDAVETARAALRFLGDVR
jgi:sugar phosphate isomerase/epimerase